MSELETRLTGSGQVIEVEGEDWTSRAMVAAAIDDADSDDYHITETSIGIGYGYVVDGDVEQKDAVEEAIDETVVETIETLKQQIENSNDPISFLKQLDEQYIEEHL